MPAAPAKIMVIAPNRHLVEHVADRVGLKKEDCVWIRDHRMLRGVAGAQIIEAISNRPFDALRDKQWADEYSRIQQEARKVIERGHLDTLALVYCK